MKISTLYSPEKKLKKLKYNTVFSCDLKTVDKKRRKKCIYRGTHTIILTLQLFISWGRKQWTKRIYKYLRVSDS